MKRTIITCDICGSDKNVEAHHLPMYRKFDSTDGRTFYDEPHIVFEAIDICEECLKKCTNIFDQRVQGYGDIVIRENPNFGKAMKQVSFKVAKAIKEAGYYFSTEVNEYFTKYFPTYLEVWLWLWREKKITIEVVIDKSTNEAYPIINDHTDWIFDSEINPEEAIIAAIEYLVENDLIK